MTAIAHERPQADWRVCAAGVVSLLALLPGATAAMPPLLECDGAGVLAEAEEIYHGYAFQHLPEGVVAYQLYRRTDDALVFIVEHCPSGSRMTATSAPTAGETEDQARSRANAVLTAVQDAIDSPQAHTLRQVARLAESAGAYARVGQAEYESCACRLTTN